MNDSLDNCGCCDGIAVLTPQSLENLPGLSQLVYRVGTHGSFKQSMLARLTGLGELSRLTTRADDDPSIALLDAAATLMDVLSFYQERIANENYLRTAVERRSVLELARAIGYELNPGVAASTSLAFTLETTPGAPAKVTIPSGVKVMSIPGPNELPQTFETIEAVEARPEWNVLRPSLDEFHLPGYMEKTVYLEGISNNLKPGDTLLIVGDERSGDPTSEQWDVRGITAVQTFPAADGLPGYTQVTLNEGLGSAAPYVLPAGVNPRVYALRTRANLFGFNAPDFRTMPANILTNFNYTTSDQIPPTKTEWPSFTIQGVSGTAPSGEGPNAYLLNLDAIYPQAAAGSWIVLSHATHRELYYVKKNADDAKHLFTLSGKSSQLLITGENLYQKFDAHLRDTVVYLQSEELAFARVPRSEPVEGDRILLDRYLPGLEENRSLLVSGRRMRARITTTAVLKMTTLDEAQQISLSEDETLIVTASPVTAGGKVTWQLLNRDGVEGTLTVYPSQVQYAPPEEGDPFVSEPVTLLHNTPTPDSPQLPPGEVLSELQFTQSLTNSYFRNSVTLLANVALATQGETKSEILGSGDASQSMQTFILKNKPLTYTPATTASGGQSTLEVRVNDIKWTEVPTLYGQDSQARVYVTRLAEGGSVTVQFGDGQTGARLPSGVDNVRAIYRTGSGSAGLIKENQLSLLVTRPLGVQKVTNPMATAGAADPEKLDRARQNAPLTVLTLDRIVSLQDFEDFTRAFSGIGKAQASWVWNGEQRLVHLTVAAATSLDGLDYTVDRKSTLFTNLRKAIDLARDTTQPVQIDSYTPLFFRLEASVLVDPAYLSEKVLPAVREALLARFGFASRNFGQSVHASEILAAMQDVDGVTAAFLKKFYLRGKEGQPADAVLPAHRAYPSTAPADKGKLKPAELLLIDSSPSATASGEVVGIDLKEVKS